MPDILQTGDVIQVRPAVYLSPQLGEMILHYQAVQQAGPRTILDVLTVLDNAIAAQLKPLCSAAATYLGSAARRVRPFPTVEYKAVGNAGVCTGAATPLSLQTCGIISKFTNTPGRGGRGRAYVPFPDVTQIGPTGVPIPAYVTLLANFITSVYPAAGLTVGPGPNFYTLQPVLYNRATLTANPLTVVIPETAFATQKRRGNYGRPNLNRL